MSQRITYTVAKLRQMLEEQRDRKVALAEEELAQHLDDDGLEGKVRDWRDAQAERVADLAERLADPTDDVPDGVLEAFTVAPCPRPKTRHRSPQDDHRRAVDDAVDAFTARLRRLEGTEATELDLTPTMLRDWFGL